MIINTPLDITLVDYVLRLTAAAVLGGVIGFERELKDKPAGMRTHMLVSLGAALFVVAAVAFGEQLTERESEIQLGMDRVLAGIITGIGFLGAGTIFQTQDRVRGLTSAAGIWITAGIGLTAGLGFYVLAVIATVLAFIIIAVLRRIEDNYISPG